MVDNTRVMLGTAARSLSLGRGETAPDDSDEPMDEVYEPDIGDEAATQTEEGGIEAAPQTDEIDDIRPRPSHTGGH